jgi:hypothetical protein
MSCDLAEINGEIEQMRQSIAVAEATVNSLPQTKAQLAELETMKRDCEAAAAAKKPAGKGVGAAWAASHTGTAPIVASHRSGAVGKGTSNTGVFSGLLGGRRTRRSKAKRSKAKRSKSRKMRR